MCYEMRPSGRVLQSTVQALIKLRKGQGLMIPRSIGPALGPVPDMGKGSDSSCINPSAQYSVGRVCPIVTATRST